MVDRAKAKKTGTFQSHKQVPLLSAKISNKNRDASSRL
jgi:hypothetical protein